MTSNYNSRKMLTKDTSIASFAARQTSPTFNQIETTLLSLMTKETLASSMNKAKKLEKPTAAQTKSFDNSRLNLGQRNVSLT